MVLVKYINGKKTNCNIKTIQKLCAVNEVWWKHYVDYSHNISIQHSTSRKAWEKKQTYLDSSVTLNIGGGSISVCFFLVVEVTCHVWFLRKQEPIQSIWFDWLHGLAKLFQNRVLHHNLKP